MEWTEKANYYIELPEAKLFEVFSKMFVDIIGYDNSKEWMLDFVKRNAVYLENTVLISIQITNAMYANSDNKHYKISNAVKGWIDYEDFHLAKHMFSPYEIISEEEYLSKIPNHEIIT